MRAAAACLCLVLLSCAWTHRSVANPIRNVVLVSLDALGAKHVSAYGYPRDTTPRLDALAREGVLFERAYTEQAWTLTSHLSLMTGLYPQVHGASSKHAAREDIQSLASLLSAAGFETRAFVGAGGYMDPHFGMGRGFDDYEISSAGVAASNPRRMRVLDQLAAAQRADPQKRFFYFLHYYDVHSDVGTSLPYASPPKYARRYWPKGLRWKRRGDTQLLIDLQNAGNVSRKDRTAVTALYDGGVRYCDALCLGTLFDELARLGLSDNTLVVVTADHGEEIFEHGKCTHQQPYEETARVPLVFAGPGIGKGLRRDFDVQLIDVMPTLLGLLEIPIPKAVQGRDLSAWLQAEAPPPPPDEPVFIDGIFGALPAVYWRYPSAVIARIGGRRFSLVTRVHYTRGKGKSFRFDLPAPKELYDLDADPQQTDNVKAAHPEIAATLGKQLLAWYRKNDRLRLGGTLAPKAPGIDPAERKRLRTLGYLHER